MPTVLFIMGWRLFFYSNENGEPIHIHAEKAEMECKFWLLIDELDIKEEYCYNMGPKDLREVRKIIFTNFDLIVEAWTKHFK
jgi:Domain of unknown function (DUF4160)